MDFKINGYPIEVGDTVYHIKLGKSKVMVIHNSSMRWCIDIKNEEGFYLTVTVEELSWKPWPIIDLGHKKETVYEYKWLIIPEDPRSTRMIQYYTESEVEKSLRGTNAKFRCIEETRRLR